MGLGEYRLRRLVTTATKFRTKTFLRTQLQLQDFQHKVGCILNVQNFYYSPGVTIRE
jgi:hypothetical protein